MSFALNEVEAMAKKAARGAGHSWGISEEAGKATRRLCAWGLDGCAVLATALEAIDECDLARRAPTALIGEWTAKDGEFCPLLAGAALSDAAALWKADGLCLQNVVAPTLLLPFAAMAAHALGVPVTVRWDGVEATTDGDSLALNGGGTALTATAARVTVSAGDTHPTPCAPAHRATPRPEDWAALGEFAQRTYAPATEASRLKGAGAGLSDND